MVENHKNLSLFPYFYFFTSITWFSMITSKQLSLHVKIIIHKGCYDAHVTKNFLYKRNYYNFRYRKVFHLRNICSRLRKYANQVNSKKLCFHSCYTSPAAEQKIKVKAKQKNSIIQ